MTDNTKTRDYLATERTFLAWMRTSLGLMVFGFVVQKFNLFIREISGIPGASQLLPFASSIGGYSFIFALFLVGLGFIICMLAFCKYKKTQKQIENDNYQPSSKTDVLLTISILLIGIIIIFLMNI